MYNLHATGKTPFHFLTAVSNYTKHILPEKLDSSCCVLLPPNGNTVCYVTPLLEDHSINIVFLVCVKHFEMCILKARKGK